MRSEIIDLNQIYDVFFHYISTMGAEEEKGLRFWIGMVTDLMCIPSSSSWDKGDLCALCGDVCTFASDLLESKIEVGSRGLCLRSIQRRK